MKTIKYLSLLAILLLGFYSCDFLDVVPDEKPTEEDAFEDINAAERFLYSCYSYLPQSRAGALSLDLMTGDEVITAFEHETFARFSKGNYSPSNVENLISYWNTFFQGLKQCYILLNNIDGVPKMSDANKIDYKAQANFLIGYYHFLLVRCYGPVILIESEPDLNTPASDYQARVPYDECIEFVCNKFDEAAADLPDSRVQSRYGLATKPAALALKAKMLLYAASPLFNGNSEFYSNFKDKNGNLLMPVTYDAGKWATAKTAFQEAISAAEAAGHGLLTQITGSDLVDLLPEDNTQKLLRLNLIESGNKEILWADSRDEGGYGLQNKSLPYTAATGWNGVAPTWTMLNRFYTKNGLPYDEDPEFSSANKFELITVTDEHADISKLGGRTMKFNLDREPRFYAWVAFQNGYYELKNDAGDPAYINTNSNYEDIGRLVCDFVGTGNCARSARTNDYSPTGYLNKKGIHPGYEVKTSIMTPRHYPWPIIRMADVYLGYAEACVETNDLSTAREYLNKIRTRAGIPTVEVSWSGVAELTQIKLREIVRQERQIEFYLENQNFWDMRRWLLAGNAFGRKQQGMNIDAANLEDFASLEEVVFERSFDIPAQYLMPIPVGDVNKNENLVQNPGY